jgi:WD40 repeat protein
VRAANPSIPTWLAEIIDKLRDPDPARRFPSAGEVADLLERHLAAPDRSPTPQGPAARARIRRTRVVVLLAGAVLALAGLLVLAEATGLYHRPTPAEPDADRAFKAVSTGPNQLARTRATVHPWARLEGHTGAVTALAFAPDGAALASASRDGTARVWRWEGGRWRSLALRGHTAPVQAIAWCPADAGLLATAGADWAVRLWQRDGRTWRQGDTLSGHTAPLTALAFTADGKTLVSLAGQGPDKQPAAVRVWDVPAGRPRQALGLAGATGPVALSPDGRQAASPGSDGTVKVWDPATGKVLASLESGPATDVAFAPDGGLLAVACLDRNVQLWQRRGAGWRKELTLRGHTDAACAVAFGPDGRTLASGSYDRTVRLWYLTTGEARAVLRGSSDRVRAVAFSPDGRNVAAAGEDAVVRLWDVARWAARRGSPPDPIGAPRVLRAFSRAQALAAPGLTRDADGLRIETKEKERSVLLFEVARPKVEEGLLLYRARLKADGNRGRALLEVRCRFPRAGEFTVRQFWPESVAGKDWARRTLPFRLEKGERPDRVQLAVSVEGPGTVWLDDAELAFAPLPAGEPRARQSLRGPSGWVWAVAFSPDGQALATACGDGTAVVWGRGRSGWERRFTLRGHRAPVRAVAFARGGRLLATGSEDRVIKLWQRDGAGWQERASLAGHAKNVVALAFSPDGTLLASAAQTWPERTPGEVKVWDVARRRQRAAFTPHTGPVKDVVFSPDGTTLVTACHDRTVKLWDTTTWAEKAVLKVAAGLSWAAAFRPDGQTLAGSAGERVVLWQREETGWRNRAVPWRHEAVVTSLAFSPDGRLLASAAEDGTVKLWDLSTGHERGSVRGHSSRATALAFSPDGKQLASVGWDGAVKLWDTSRWPAAPPALKRGAAGTFVVLSGGGAAGRAFDTLAEAVAAAGPGETVELRGNGPFITPSVLVGKKPLRIRAGKGFRPVLRLDLEGDETSAPILHSEGALVLEGLELQRCGTNDPRAAFPMLVQTDSAPLYVANCRFVVRNHGVVLHPMRTAVCEVRNCAFLRSGVNYAGIEPILHAGPGRVVADNCVFAGGNWPLFVRRHGRPQPSDSVEVRRCTLVAPGGLMYYRRDEPQMPIPADGPPVQVEAEGNVFDTTWAGVFQFDHDFLIEEKPLSFAQGQAFLKRLVGWRDGGNLYPRTANLLRQSQRFRMDDEGGVGKTLAEWNEFWGIRPSRSVQGAARYRGGDLRARVARAPESLSAADFRLQPDSPGRGLGADVDLVGPGVAYERWQRTAGYQRWLEQTRRALAGKE